MNNYDGLPCLQEGCNQTATKKGRCQNHQLPAFHTNYRSERLPKNWAQLKQVVMARDKGVCYMCNETGADGVDHLKNNDDDRLTNLAAVHHNNPNSKGVYCHRAKTAQEGNQARRDQQIKQWGNSWQQEAYNRFKKNK